MLYHTAQVVWRDAKLENILMRSMPLPIFGPHSNALQYMYIQDDMVYIDCVPCTHWHRATMTCNGVGRNIQ